MFLEHLLRLSISDFSPSSGLLGSLKDLEDLKIKSGIDSLNKCSKKIFEKIPKIAFSNPRTLFCLLLTK